MSNNENTTKSTLLPDVQAYFNTLDKGVKELAEAEAEVGKRHQVSILADRYSEEYQRELDAARAEMREARTKAQRVPGEARRVLAQSSDPLVSWIAANTLLDWREYSEEVLRMLPASVSDLKDWAEEKDLCGTWDGFLRQAEAAGVLDHLPTGSTLPQVTGPAWDDLVSVLDAELYKATSKRIQRKVRQVVRENQTTLELVKDSPSKDVTAEALATGE